MRKHITCSQYWNIMSLLETWQCNIDSYWHNFTRQHLKSTVLGRRTGKTPCLKNMVVNERTMRSVCDDFSGRSRRFNFPSLIIITRPFIRCCNMSRKSHYNDLVGCHSVSLIPVKVLLRSKWGELTNQSSLEKRNGLLHELRFNVPLDTKWVISETLFPASISWLVVRKSKLRREKRLQQQVINLG